jgi:hypothetical protein
VKNILSEDVDDSSDEHQKLLYNLASGLFVMLRHQSPPLAFRICPAINL